MTVRVWSGGHSFKVLFYPRGSQGVDTVSTVGGTGDPLEGGSEDTNEYFFLVIVAQRNGPSKVRVIDAV